MSTIEANTLKPISGSSTLTLGESGDTVTLGAGASSSGFGATLTGSTNNTVVTVTGANAMQGEANVTYADPKLMVANSGDSTFEIQSGNSNSCRLNFGDTDSSTIGQIRYRHDLNKMIVEVNGSTRLEIDNSGNVDIPTGNLTVSDSGSIGNGQGEYMQTNNVSDFLAFHTGGTERMRLLDTGYLRCIGVYNQSAGDSANVVVDGSGNIYRSTSALKYKQDVRDLESIDISSFRPVRYKSKSPKDDPEKDFIGFIADEFHDAGLTELVSYGEPDEEGNPVVEGFNYDRLTAVLTKSLQEANTKIATLETEMTALKARVAALESA